MMILCAACNQLKPESNFYRINGRPSRKCKLCFRNRERIPKENMLTTKGPNFYGGKGIDEFAFIPRESDYIAAFMLLKALGYDISQNISRQFCEKNNLIYREYKGRRESKYKNPEDLGLV